MRDDEAVEGAFQANNKGRSAGNLPRKKLVKFSKGKTSIPSRRQIFLPCPYCRRTNHAEKDCWFKGKPSLQCMFCNNLGHSEKFCRIKKKQSQQQIQQQANVSEEGKDDEEHLFMASQASNTSELNTWLIDSGCTSHMSKFLSIVSSIDRLVQPKIKLRNGDIVQAKGKGIVAVSTNRGIKTITNILYIPELDQNLLSVAHMLRNGYEVSFKERFCFITDTHDLEIAKIKINGNSFYLKLDAVDILKKFKLESCKEVTTPLAQNEKISKNDVGLLSRLMSSPNNIHMGVAKRVLKYIRGTADLGIWYSKTGGAKLIGYANSDWTGSVDDMKSISGYVFNISSCALCWNAKKQEVVAQSTIEPEYIFMAAAANQAIWLNNLLADLGQEQSSPTKLYCDNKSVIVIAQNPVQHGRIKHINVKFHSIREAKKNLLIKLYYCPTDVQLANIMTKALPRSRL